MWSAAGRPFSRNAIQIDTLSIQIAFDENGPPPPCDALAYARGVGRFGIVRCVVLVGSVAMFAGCGSAVDPTLGPVEVGDEYGYSVLTHCGIEWAQIDGAWWRTDPLNDGNGNPPPDWNNPTQGGRLRIESEDRAVFTGGPEPLVFIRTDLTDAQVPESATLCE